MAEGAPLLREYGVYSSIEGSNPSLSANLSAVNSVYSVPVLSGDASLQHGNIASLIANTLDGL